MSCKFWSVYKNINSWLYFTTVPKFTADFGLEDLLRLYFQQYRTNLNDLTKQAIIENLNSFHSNWVMIRQKMKKWSTNFTMKHFTLRNSNQNLKAKIDNFGFY